MSKMQRMGLHVALGLSILGVAAPLAQQGVQRSAAAKAVEALQDAAQPATLSTDLPAALLPTPEVPAAWGRLSPDGRHLLVRSQDRNGGLAVVDTTDGRALARWEGVADSGAFLDSDRLATWTAGGSVQLRDRSGHLLATAAAPTLRDVSVNEGRLAYTDEKELHLLRVEGDQLREVRVATGGGRVASWAGDRVAVHHDGYYRDEGRVQVVDSRDGRIVLDRQLDREDRSAQLTPDGERVLVAGGRRDSRWGGHVKMVGAEGTVWERRGFSSAVLSPDGARVALGGNGSRVELVDARTGKTVWTATGAGYDLRFSPDGSRLATSSDRALAVYDASTGAPLWARQATQAANFAFSPEGKVAIAEWTRESQKSFISLLDADDGRVLAQEPAPVRMQPLVFSRDGKVLLAQGEQGYGSTRLQVVDVARSPLDRGALAREEAREALTRLGAPQELRDRLDTLPVEVLRALEAGGARIRTAGLEGPQPATLDVPARFADPEALRDLADRAFAKADARHAARIATLEQRLEAAREEVRQKGGPSHVPLGDLLAGNLDPTSLDPGVQRLTTELFYARQERAVEAWSSLEGSLLEPAAARGGVYDLRGAAATASRPVTLEDLARAHGAKTPEETKRFADLTRAMNGPRLEKAQQTYLEAVRRLYPEAGLPTLPVERRPFLPSQADLVLPSYHHHGGRTISGRDMGALTAWQQGSRAVVLDGNVVVVGEGGAVREALGRAYDNVLRERDPGFYEGWGPRWREDWWRSHRWSEGPATAADHFASRFADFTGPGRAEFESSNSHTARLVQIAVDAAPRVAK